MDGSFWHIGSAVPDSPVIWSVPHAGRDYPPTLLAASRVGPQTLKALEDRYMDALARAALRGETLLIQRVARAWIDLNRSERERDPAVDRGAASAAQPFRSAKLRAGLGLVPRRVGGAGDLWRRPFTGAEIDARIEADHRPYHDALETALLAARSRFGVALLFDLHSMPPLAFSVNGPGVVIGDRFGRSAAGRFVSRLEREAAAAGVPVALNTPYAGGHILERHGDPRRGLHAIQLEIDRRLYLDTALDRPGPGLDAAAALVGRMSAALADEALGDPALLAAE